LAEINNKWSLHTGVLKSTVHTVISGWPKKLYINDVTQQGAGS
jgi:hypothetical protein